ncbi:MAG TPA: type II toxin-antitoxin system PemK/MazF family toxin [Thermoanaerobaculia bacterium]|nr:type II toxin-antitoxin system PemK/MazF family toxin [Thermoanaerobaculia bacterium]
MRIGTTRSGPDRELATKSGKTPCSPNRGDVVSLTFDPQAGHEQAGVRPAVAVSPRTYNERSSLILVVPVTRQIKGYPFEVVLPAKLPASGRRPVRSDQERGLVCKRRSFYLCSTRGNRERHPPTRGCPAVAGVMFPMSPRDAAGVFFKVHEDQTRTDSAPEKGKARPPGLSGGDCCLLRARRFARFEGGCRDRAG